MLFELVVLLRKLRPTLLVYGAHMELAKPTIKDGLEWCIKRGATEIKVHPYMLAPGRHATEDIPRLVNESMSAYPNIKYEVTDPLGVDEALGNLILKRSKL